MNIALWIVAGVIAALFFLAGLMKLSQPQAKLAESGMGWAAQVTPSAVKALGLVEILGALGLILPAVTGTAPALVGWSAIGIAVIMFGAIVIHLRAKEIPMAVGTAVLLAAAVLVAWGRLGAYSF